MNLLAMVNWGMGLEILKALEKNSLVQKLYVCTRSEPDNNDPWINQVYDYSKLKGFETFDEKNLDFNTLKSIIKDLNIDLVLCHAYMRILPKDVFTLPGKGTINIHASLLPKYRGSSPSRDVLLNNEKETGLTCHYIDEGIDTGDIIYQTGFKVHENDSVDSLIEKGKVIIPDLINESLKRINSVSFKADKQNIVI